MVPEFKAYPKTPRLEQETYIISEKIDGTNGILHITKCPDTGLSTIIPGSRSKWLLNDGSRSWDNHGFGQWVADNKEELSKLPEGIHYGEWYGKGINRNYGLSDRRFMLFNFHRYANLDVLPSVVELETVLEEGISPTRLAEAVRKHKMDLLTAGSLHVPGFIRTEGLIIRSRLSAKVYKEVWSKD